MKGIYEFAGITIKVLTSINQHDILNERKEITNDRDGRIAYSQRRGPYPQVHAVLHQDIVQKWRAEGASNWWTLEDQTRGPARLCRQTASPKNKQKIKPAPWLARRKEFVAANSPLTDWNPHRSELCNPLPILIVTRDIKHVNGCQVWVCERKKVYP